MEINFKIANKSDHETLLELIQEFYEVEHLPFDDNTIRALVKILNDESLGRVWLIQDGQEAIGYVVLTFGYSLEFRGRDALIDELYIREGYRRQGVGTNTLQFVEDVCSSLEVEALHLEVARGNTAAQSLYRQAGFADHDRYLMTKWIAN
ncbi:MAG TPA: GNAT family N-acetyltransferase [Cyanobacteria bacterium UBA8553]|nr:GNAT family N-acetyltransferase [Cyanobacteria bacterium UBA8553]HAJ58829.1 GNAT family N-acetyltransferase [Cyanobacteria bacterium UBA8543]